MIKYLAKLKKIEDKSFVEWGCIEQMILAWNLFIRIFRGVILKTKSLNIKGINFCEKNVKIYHGRFISSDGFLNTGVTYWVTILTPRDSNNSSS